ncbi:unnamed protein product [Haemonchus placei]|uniref:Uncharacterized protein n=1 Tax=Haemonchus placei TaxID=6290 RepID=A0A0N4X4Z8_HAEPC|nr:unnamed protein product [Haemonchus placei]
MHVFCDTLKICFKTLLKRRPYHRQSIGQSTSDHGGSNVGEHGKWQFVEYKL